MAASSHAHKRCGEQLSSVQSLPLRPCIDASKDYDPNVVLTVSPLGAALAFECGQERRIIGASSPVA